MTEKTYTNRLREEVSPYLLQHAHNPVDWYPWGPEAFEKAQKENKPVFLSIGYSACHWCHVMAYESFEDVRIANVLNQYFVSIKVDREERPDIDSIYMVLVQALTGTGGWPLSVFLTPTGRPFYGGTYFPPTGRGWLPGFYDLLLVIHESWVNRKDILLDSSRQLCQQVQSQLLPQDEGELTENMLHQGFEAFKQIFDEVNGGFGSAPKFPQPVALLFLMIYYHRTGNPKALKMVEDTLHKIAGGGIHDHLGGGYHRYSVDAVWLVPHFEKMLYDQALLAQTFIQAYQISRGEFYAGQACDIYDYVLRDMSGPEGGFYSSRDADSQDGEGLYYLWGYDEVMGELEKYTGRIFSSYYGITRDGNFKRKNILTVQKSTEELSAEFECPLEVIQEILHHGREKLFQLRQQRVNPGRDEKIITAWNGLMISSLAQGGAALGKEHYIQAAEKTARFILRNLYIDNRLWRSVAGGKIGAKGFLEDYALLIHGLLDLYEAGYETYWLEKAIHLADEMIDLFEDSRNGSYFFTGKDAEQLVIRQKPMDNSVIPGGNPTAALVMMKIGLLTGRSGYLERGQRILHVFSKSLQSQGVGMPEMLIALDFMLGPQREIVIAGSPEDFNTRQVINMVHGQYMPRSVVLLHNVQNPHIEKMNSSIRSMIPILGKTSVYMCQNYTCTMPLVDLADIQKALNNMKASNQTRQT